MLKEDIKTILNKLETKIKVFYNATWLSIKSKETYIIMDYYKIDSIEIDRDRSITLKLLDSCIITIYFK